MIDGLAVIDAHMHVPRLSTVRPAWLKWAEDFGKDSPWRSVFGPDGHADPAAEAARQLGLGAVAVKLHPVHGAFSPEDPVLRAVYELCAERGVPVITHTGGSIFPGSKPSAGDPALMRDVIAAFPGLTFVL